LMLFIYLQVVINTRPYTAIHNYAFYLTGLSAVAEEIGNICLT
jgi:hypothetical protein